MKHTKLYEDFINESIDIKYWAGYNKDTSGQGNRRFELPEYDFDDCFDYAVEDWNAEADGSENRIKGAQINKVKKLAMQFFKKAGYITVNIAQAMISQEAIGESVVSEAKDTPSLDSMTGLIYYFDIPFTSEDVEEILASSKTILNAKFTPNKQFEIQPMIFIKDKVNGGEHTFSVAQIGILGAFFDKNKNSIASRKDF
jgi:hypothetical protein